MAARGRIGAYVTHSRHNPAELTRKAREVFRTTHLVEQARSEAAARGEEITDAEAERRGKALLKAHYARMAQASIASRRKRAKS